MTLDQYPDGNIKAVTGLSRSSSSVLSLRVTSSALLIGQKSAVSLVRRQLRVWLVSIKVGGWTEVTCLCLTPPLLAGAPSVVSSSGPVGPCAAFGPCCPLRIPERRPRERRPLLRLWTPPAGPADLLKHCPTTPRRPATLPTCSPLPGETGGRKV